MNRDERCAAERDRRAAEVLVAVFAAPDGEAPSPDPATWRMAGRPLTPRELRDVREASEAAWAPLDAVHDAEGAVLAEEARVVAELLDGQADLADDQGRTQDARSLRVSAVRLRAVAMLTDVGNPR